MSIAATEDSERPPNALPRWIAALIIGAIALASLAALVWPILTKPPVRPDAGVINAQIETSGAAGRIGAYAPDFEWIGDDGELLRLSSYRGEVVVVNFWTTWCLSCRQEMPALQRVAASEQGVVVLDSLGLDRLRPVVDADGETSRRYGVLSFPSTFFIDKDGVIRHLELRPLGENEMRKGIQKAR
jgi:peroxiredoxin